MKRFTIIAAMMSAFLCGAQTEPRFTIGSKAGFGHSFISPGSDGFNGSWMVGLTTMYMMSEHVGFGADALYSSEGGTLLRTDGTNSNTEIDYMRVPLRVIYAMGGSDNAIRPRVSVGPTFGVNMAEGTGIKDMDFGLNAGAGLNIRMTEGLWLGLDAAYYHGLMDIYAPTSTTERNGNLRLEVSLTFGL